MANASNSSANRYKGRDIDTDGDGRVGKADHASNASNAQNVKGNDIDSDGDGVVDKADTSADRPSAGDGLNEDSQGRFNVTTNASVEASETNDGSDLTQYSKPSSTNSAGTNLVSVTGSGVLLGGTIWSDTSWASDPIALMTITVDGGSSYNVVASEKFGDGYFHGSLPVVRFESSLTIERTRDNVGGNCWVKQ
jgi:hypothetical protein